MKFLAFIVSWNNDLSYTQGLNWVIVNDSGKNLCAEDAKAPRKCTYLGVSQCFFNIFCISWVNRNKESLVLSTVYNIIFTENKVVLCLISCIIIYIISA